MSGHTPGPWVVSNGRLVRVRPKGSASPICGVHRRGNYTYGADDLETLANAHLIAAAPETAAKLERAREDIAELCIALSNVVSARSPETIKAARDLLDNEVGREALQRVAQGKAALAKHSRAETFHGD